MKTYNSGNLGKPRIRIQNNPIPKKAFWVGSLARINLCLLLFSLSLNNLRGSPELDSLAHPGNTKAQFYFAQLCYSDSSTKEKQALYWIKSMGSQGNALACQYTARAYWKGLGTSKNSLKAKDWFLKAYAMGDPDSLSFLGKVLEEDQKPLEAVAAYELAYQKYKSKEAGYRLKEIKSSLPTISEDTIAEKISILRLDTDFYESTKIELEILFPRLEKNGILIIDDYGFKFGARKAVDEYFKTKPFLIYVDHDCRLLINN